MEDDGQNGSPKKGDDVSWDLGLNEFWCQFQPDEVDLIRLWWLFEWTVDFSYHQSRKSRLCVTSRRSCIRNENEPKLRTLPWPHKKPNLFGYKSVLKGFVHFFSLFGHINACIWLYMYLYYIIFTSYAEFHNSKVLCIIDPFGPWQASTLYLWRRLSDLL